MFFAISAVVLLSHPGLALLVCILSYGNSTPFTRYIDTHNITIDFPILFNIGLISIGSYCNSPPFCPIRRLLLENSESGDSHIHISYILSMAFEASQTISKIQVLKPPVLINMPTITNGRRHIVRWATLTWGKVP